MPTTTDGDGREAHPDGKEDLTPDSPIRELFKRWKIEAGYLTLRQNAGTATLEDGKELEISSGHGLGSLNVYFEPSWRKDKFILDFDRLIPVVLGLIDETPEDAPLKEDEHRKGAAKKAARR